MIEKLTFRLVKKVAKGVTLSLLLSVTASAAFNLTINTAADTITISGTDSATIQEEFVFSERPESYVGIAAWSLGVIGTGAFDVIDDNQNFHNAYTDLNGTIVPEASGLSRIIVYDNGGLALEVRLEYPNSPLAEVSESDITISYADAFFASNESVLASLDGQTLATFEGDFESGSGYSPVAIRIVAEPMTYGILISGIALVATIVLLRLKAQWIGA